MAFTRIAFFVMIFLISYLNSFSQNNKLIKIDTLTYQTQSGLPIAASKIYFTDSKFAFSGYGESNYINYLGPKNRESQDIELYMTNLQRFVGYLAYKPKKWLVLYAEVFAELMNDGRSERQIEFAPEVFADFLLDEKFKVRVGTHQPTIGFINNSDEPVMFYSVNRPEVERLIIPSQWIDLGVMTYGNINDKLEWTFSLYQGLDPLTINGASWIRGGRENPIRFNFDGFTINPSIKYTGFNETEIAVNGIVSRYGTNSIKSHTFLMSSYVRKEIKNWTFMFLGTYGYNDNTQGIFDLTLNSSFDNTGQVLGKSVYGAYAEVGFDIWPLLKRSKSSTQERNGIILKSDEIKLPLFARVERLNTHNTIEEGLTNEQVFQSNLTALTIGLNFNTRRNIVIKTNYQFRFNKNPLVNGEFEGDRFEMGLGFIF